MTDDNRWLLKLPKCLVAGCDEPIWFNPRKREWRHYFEPGDHEPVTADDNRRAYRASLAAPPRCGFCQSPQQSMNVGMRRSAHYAVGNSLTQTGAAVVMRFLNRQLGNYWKNRYHYPMVGLLGGTVRSTSPMGRSARTLA